MTDMATNLGIDDRLVETAKNIGGHATKKAAVTEALQEYIQRRQQSKIIELFGKIDFHPRFNHKKLRRR